MEIILQLLAAVGGFIGGYFIGFLEARKQGQQYLELFKSNLKIELAKQNLYKIKELTDEQDSKSK